MRTIDLRSDTVTRPTNEMRQAMAQAAVGDDVYGDDPTVNQLEQLTAEMLHKEAALFVPSGTFGNQLALLTHCKRGDEVILSDDCHIVQHEGGASAVIAGVQLRAISTRETSGGAAGFGEVKPTEASKLGQIPLDAIETRIRKDADDIHYPSTGLICLENAHSCGYVLSLDYMECVAELAQKHHIPIHLDGARLFNAAEHLQVEPWEIADTVDSLMLCLSKGLCAPVGSMLAGSADFIAKARRNRKIMGGGMRQVGILAAAGIIALEKMSLRLGQDHKNARLLGKWLNQIEGISLCPKYIQANMVFCQIDFKFPLTPEIFIRRLAESGILVNPPENSQMRFVTHNDVREADVRRAVDEMKGILTKDFW